MNVQKIQELWATIKYYFNKNYHSWILFVISCVVIGYISAWGKIDNLPDSFVKFWDPLFGLYGILFTLGFAFFYARKEWQSGLEKRLTVHFEYKGKYLMSCYEAYLASEGDIRAWGQQIGSQMVKKEQLDFYPYLTQEKPNIEYDKANQCFYASYTVTIHLRTIDNLLNKEENLKEHYLIWWENDNKTLANKALFIPNHPVTPLKLSEVKELDAKLSVNAHQAKDQI